MVRTKFWLVHPKSQEVRTIHAVSPVTASDCSFVRAYTESGAGGSDSTYGSRLRPSKT